MYETIKMPLFMIQKKKKTNTIIIQDCKKEIKRGRKMLAKYVNKQYKVAADVRMLEVNIKYD